MRGYVFWAAVAGFLIGIFARSFFQINPALFLFIALLLGGAAFLFYRGHPKIGTFTFPVALLFFAFGILRMDAAAFEKDPVLDTYTGERITLEGIVFAEPDARQDSVRLSVRADSLIVGEEATAVHIGVLAKLPAHANVSYGDRVRVSGILKEPESFDTSFGRQFNYPSYLAAQGIEYQLSRASIEAVVMQTGNPLKAGAIWVKHTFERGLGGALPEPEAGFAGGITVGDKRSIGPELSSDFQRAGLIHMIVLSGYNITIVLDGAFWILKHTPIVREVRFAPLGISGAIVLFFVLMTGGASSAVRAGLMALIAVYARFSRRTFLASRALGVAAVAIVAWNPYTLAFDPGFQLSALATAGLVVFTPLISSRLSFVTEKFALREIASSTIGTQIAVLPLLLYQNGQLPIYALPANLLTLLFVPYAMLFSLIAGVGGMFFGPLSTVLALPAYMLLSYIIHIAQFVAHLPYAGIAIPPFGALWLVLAYALLFEYAAYLHLKKK